MNFIKKFTYILLAIQEKVITKRLEKTLGYKAKNKRKKVFNSGCLLTLDSIVESERNKMEEEISLILNSCEYEPLRVLEYIKTQNTSVYYINNAQSLHLINENEGFIYPQSGLKALYLSLVINKNFKFQTQEMFVLSGKNINKYYFMYHFYNWYAFKHGIEGVNAESQMLLNKYLFNNSDEEINKLQLADICKLKDAIKQDKAAIEFVFKLCQKYDGARNALVKLKDEGAKI